MVFLCFICLFGFGVFFVAAVVLFLGEFLWVFLWFLFCILSGQKSTIDLLSL